jgi:hypothetical protein
VFPRVAFDEACAREVLMGYNPTQVFRLTT